MSPDNFQKVIKYQTFQKLFHTGFESVENIVCSFETNLGWKYIQSDQNVATIKDN